MIPTNQPVPIRITPTSQPQLPCWIWSPTNFRNAWNHVTIAAELFEGDTHWLPDQPDAPTVVPGEQEPAMLHHVFKKLTDAGKLPPSPAPTLPAEVRAQIRLSLIFQHQELLDIDTNYQHLCTTLASLWPVPPADKGGEAKWAERQKLATELMVWSVLPLGANVNQYEFRRVARAAAELLRGAHLAPGNGEGGANEPFDSLMGQICAMKERSWKYRGEAEDNGKVDEAETHMRVYCVLKELQRLGGAFKERFAQLQPAPQGNGEGKGELAEANKRFVQERADNVEMRRLLAEVREHHAEGMRHVANQEAELDDLRADVEHYKIGAQEDHELIRLFLAERDALRTLLGDLVDWSEHMERELRETPPSIDLSPTNWFSAVKSGRSYLARKRTTLDQNKP